MDHHQRYPGRDEAAVARFVEGFSGVLTDSGVPRMPSRVFSALLASDPGRLTAVEVAEQLGVSAAAISGAVRYLSQVGMIIRVREPGARRDSYALPHDVWPDMIGQRDRLLARWEASLRDGVEVLGADTPAGARLAESVEFFSFVQRELPEVLERWRAQRTARRRGSVPAASAPAHTSGATSV